MSNAITSPVKSVILGFRFKADEICALVCYCAAGNGNWSPKFRNGTDRVSQNVGKELPPLAPK